MSLFDLFVCFFMRRDILLTEVPCIIIQLGKSFSTHSSAFFLLTCTTVLGPSINPEYTAGHILSIDNIYEGLRLEPNPPKAKVLRGFLGKHSRVLLYMHQFLIVSSVNSWVARLLCLPPTFHFVRLGVQRENHCDCASS